MVEQSAGMPSVWIGLLSIYLVLLLSLDQQERSLELNLLFFDLRTLLGWVCLNLCAWVRWITQ